MSNDTNSPNESQPKQMTLWNNDPLDNRPLPEIIADQYSFTLAYHDVGDVRHYAVQDWIKGVAQTDNPRRFWADMKKRSDKAGSQLYAQCVQLPYKASNGKTYQMDHAAAETLYQIAQRMDAETGLRDKVLSYLAKAGVLLDDIRIDPSKGIEAGVSRYERQGKSPEWIEARTAGIYSRNAFTLAVKNAIVDLGKETYAHATETLYKGLWQRTTKQLRGELNLNPKQNVRDAMSSIALAYTNIAEAACARKLGEAQEVPETVAMEIIYEIAKIISQQAKQTAGLLGVDPFTGKPLLSDGK
jgi:hypothetical protein